MDCRIVVAAGQVGFVKARLNDFAGKMAQRLVVARPGKGHYPAVIGRNRRLVEADVAKIVAQFAMATDRFILLQEADAVLRNENPSRIQAAFAAFIKSRGEEAFPGPIGSVQSEMITSNVCVV